MEPLDHLTERFRSPRTVREGSFISLCGLELNFETHLEKSVQFFQLVDGKGGLGHDGPYL